MAVIGGAAGLCYAVLKKTVYTAVCTFVLDDESKGGSLSQYSGRASLAGIDLDAGGGGLFSEENIFDLYTSRLMIEKTFLSTADFNGKNEMLIERYIDYNISCASAGKTMSISTVSTLPATLQNSTVIRIVSLPVSLKYVAYPAY